MTDVQTEIQDAVVSLELIPEQFRQLPDIEAEQVYRACLAKFVNASFEPRWWWEHFRKPHSYYDPDDGVFSFNILPQLVPNPDSPCFFIAEDIDTPFYPVYFSTPRVVALIVAECFAFEYYVISLDCTWLICEDHHNRIHGVGEPIV